LLAEAAAALAVSATAVTVLPFRRIAAWLSTQAQERRRGEPWEIEQVRRAIDAWTRRLPVAPKCFSRGLGAYWMLRRRGIDAQLCYGAATIAGELKAHVWVKAGGMDVVGCENADEYALLVRFPDEARSASVHVADDRPDHEE
jgi:hypothetical protein